MKRLVWAMALVVVLPISAALPEVKGKGSPPIALSTEQYEKMLTAINKIEEFKSEMQVFNAALKPIQDHLNEISNTVKQVKADVDKHSTQLNSIQGIIGSTSDRVNKIDTEVQVTK